MRREAGSGALGAPDAAAAALASLEGAFTCQICRRAGTAAAAGASMRGPLAVSLGSPSRLASIMGEVPASPDEWPRKAL
jgi:hypothetical protein